jgi:alcohol dehydrogenase class IV
VTEPFRIATAGEIRFGAGRAAEVPALVAGIGTKALVVTGRSPLRHAGLLDALDAAGVAITVHAGGGEPTVADAVEAVELARGHDVVLGLGGGSVLDLAKAAAALVVADDPLDHLEVVGRGLPLPGPGLPVVAVPTTAGSGSEVTANAVLAVPEHATKASVRGPTLLPRAAVVDPTLTLACPPAVSASSGLDALTQCLEPLVSPLGNPVTDAFARTGLAACGRSLVRVVTAGDDLAARTDLALAALLGGLALANAKLGAVHGLAGVLGGRTGAAHGALCAALLPATVEVTARALARGEDGGRALARYREAAALLTADPDADLPALVRWLRETTQQLEVPGLAALGLRLEDVPAVVAGAAVASSTRGHPVVLTHDELAEIVARSWD